MDAGKKSRMNRQGGHWRGIIMRNLIFEKDQTQNNLSNTRIHIAKSIQYFTTDCFMFWQKLVRCVETYKTFFVPLYQSLN